MKLRRKCDENPVLVCASVHDSIFGDCLFVISSVIFLSSRASSNWTQPIGAVEATALLDGNRGQEGGFSKDECRSFVWIELFFPVFRSFSKRESVSNRRLLFLLVSCEAGGKKSHCFLFYFFVYGGGRGDRLSISILYFFSYSFQLLRQ